MDASSTLIASQSPSRKRPRELTMSLSISENHKSVPTTVKSSPTSNKPYANGSTSSSLNGFPSSSSASSYVSIMDDHRNGSSETGKLSPTSSDPDYMVSVTIISKTLQTSKLVCTESKIGLRPFCQH